MKNRISQKEWEYIDEYNPAAKWVRPLCSYSLVKVEDNCFRRECKISWPVYLILFIPCHLLQALWCMWDGGLKEFEIGKRNLSQDVYHENYGWCKLDYSKAKEVWEKHN